MRKPTIWLLIAILAIALAFAAVLFFLRRRTAPEAVRLLPEASGYVYLNLKPLRAAGVIGNAQELSGDPDYQEFVRESGVQFERDLDEAAFAIHTRQGPPEGGTPSEEQDGIRRYSEIFVGRIDSQRLRSYLRKVAAAVERYRDVDIYSIPLPGRTVRVALLEKQRLDSGRAASMAAVSNAPGPEVIRGMIDRYYKRALPSGGPHLIREYYKHVPFGSTAWVIARSAGETTGGWALPGGVDFFLPGGTTLVGAARYVGSIQLKAEAFTASPAQAKQIASQIGAFLSILRGLEASGASGTDSDVKALFDSLKVEEKDSRAVLTATVPAGFLKKILAEPPQPGPNPAK